MLNRVPNACLIALISVIEGPTISMLSTSMAINVLPWANTARSADSGEKPSSFRNVARVRNQIRGACFRPYRALFSKQTRLLPSS